MAKTAFWLVFAFLSEKLRVNICFRHSATKRNRTALAICGDSIAKREILRYKNKYFCLFFLYMQQIAFHWRLCFNLSFEESCSKHRKTISSSILACFRFLSEKLRIDICFRHSRPKENHLCWRFSRGLFVKESCSKKYFIG